MVSFEPAFEAAAGDLVEAVDQVDLVVEVVELVQSSPIDSLPDLRPVLGDAIV